MLRQQKNIIFSLIILFFSPFIYGVDASKINVLMVVSSHSELGQTNIKTGYWLSELTHPWMVLYEQGFNVDIASPKGGDAPIDPRSEDLTDPENKKVLNTETLHWKIQHTLPLGQINPSHYQVIFFVGGHGPLWDFTHNPDIQKDTRLIYEKGGIVAAVCHGPAALVNVKLSNGNYLIAGKKITAFSNAEENAIHLQKIVPYSLEDALKSHGAYYQAGLPQEKNVVIDGRLITGQNPASAKAVGEAIISTLQALPH